MWRGRSAHRGRWTLSLWTRLLGKKRDPAEREALIEELSRELRCWIRSATRLVPDANATSEADAGSRTGGSPHAGPGEEWPHCSGCARPLDFVAQVDLRDCPARPTEAFDLFTFFYCWECFPWGDPEEPGGRWAVRTYREPIDPERTLSPPGGDVQRTRRSVLRPRPIEVLASGEELDARDRALGQRLEALPEYLDLVEELEDRLIAEPIREGEATFVGGFPTWIQSDGAPTSASGRRFELLAQLDSEPAPGWMWGDAGIVYLMFDPDAPTDVRLVLQCH